MVLETSLVVQCLRLCASNAGNVGSIPGWGTEILYALGLGQNLRQETSGFVLWSVRHPGRSLHTLAALWGVGRGFHPSSQA